MHHPKYDVKSSNLCIKIGSCIWFAVVKHISRWWNQNYLQSRISLSGFCSENIIWPKRIKRSWNKNLQRNDPLMLFFVQLVLMDYGRPTVKVSIADNWQGRGWRFGVALNSRWVLWSFLSQINPISWKLMWILSNIFLKAF